MSISQPDAFDAWAYFGMKLEESDRAAAIYGGPQRFTIQPYDSNT